MHLCLFEDTHVHRLRPLVETRPAYDLRLARRTMGETIRDAVAADGLVLHTRPPLADVVALAHPNPPVNTLPDGADVLFVNGRLVADNEGLVARLREQIDTDDARRFLQDGVLVAAWVPDAAARLPSDVLDQAALPSGLVDAPVTSIDGATLVERPWDLLDTLPPALARDAATYASVPPAGALSSRHHATVHPSVVAVDPGRIHLGREATVRPGAILNASNGPIVVDDAATIHERAVLNGPCYVGPKCEIKVGADIERSAFGYYCKVGGEVHDSIIHALSNKAHPGFLGHSYLGQWCNLGADTNTSNLKNDYGEISAYAPADQHFVDTGRQFAGLFMGDHSKCGINTMFNTGTVVGTCSNLFGGDFPPRYVPPFSWGGPSQGLTTYRLGKALSVAETVMGRRDTPLTDADTALLSGLFERTAEERVRHHD
jgi:UDP-N-acetylglucosamine diphosphorylase/glucosamine-1-phosphate N-acetyltransferase